MCVQAITTSLIVLSVLMLVTTETEKREQSSHPYRLAAVCLGLLCALLLTATIVLGVLYMRAGEEGALRQNDTIEEGVAEQLRANCSIHTDDNGQQQENYNKMAEEKCLIQKNYNKMAEGKDKLQKNYDKMAEDKAQLQKRNKVLTEVNAQLQKNCSTVWKDYNTLDNDKRQLVTDYNVLAKEKIQRERDYSALETECQTLTREKKRVEEERKTLQQLLEEERDMFQRWNRTFMVVLENMKHKEQLQRDLPCWQNPPSRISTVPSAYRRECASPVHRAGSNSTPSVTTSPRRGRAGWTVAVTALSRELTWW
ncbi:uncharacterized protein LOC133107193 isoform X3 [Conger conger]|uniref:uncharacterized protein LOC133107193 isoform X3 n=1 Tax=Conger conger TaxID=82655 RepID=UPI002A59A92C|nr:uncharacterized protein LOC133107193 isoform X3 [Conger conger]XP_061072104.1 uncharacterized protein LOC133107193 isoform X3 [Conger conger]XP_061072105.1 uncharacterized protein LOC133107193 isoform X3 [Conger conger]XP_061072106.1 uncharacterized protein LOC133107193 isoform X3 [Conger conger]XP_061072107.1 uncharacterized protein LOC133107193 isoform X3 [Conger conger]